MLFIIQKQNLIRFSSLEKKRSVLLPSITLKTFHVHSWTSLVFYSCCWFQTLLSDLCCSCLNTLSPLLPCHGWSCLPSSASCSLFSAWNHRGIRVMHKVHLSDVTPVTSGQLELSPWKGGMATALGKELSGRSCDCTQRASQQKRKPYIVIPSFTFFWCNSKKYQICWIIDMFSPLMSCALLSALPRTAPVTTPHLFQKDFMSSSEQQTPKSSCSCFPPRSAAAAEQLL